VSGANKEEHGFDRTEFEKRTHVTSPEQYMRVVKNEKRKYRRKQYPVMRYLMEGMK
jgi:hypothetical protein